MLISVTDMTEIKGLILSKKISVWKSS